MVFSFIGWPSFCKWITAIFFVRFFSLWLYKLSINPGILLRKIPFNQKSSVCIHWVQLQMNQKPLHIHMFLDQSLLIIKPYLLRSATVAQWQAHNLWYVWKKSKSLMINLSKCLAFARLEKERKKKEVIKFDLLKFFPIKRTAKASHS